ncbi:MAG: phospholipid carrier-dependent glycosyltransferase [Methylotenera sp.]|nr:phospholipid carrier-dependent glycosyltransferase [Oligoflexia bacterium]
MQSEPEISLAFLSSSSNLPSADRKRTLKKILLSCVLLYWFAQVFFLINIQFPRTQNFDEFHYVPSAKQFLQLKENQNWEHPPLAKLLMAGGIAIGGDRPLGWRLMSTVFGSLTLVGMFLWGLAVFRNWRAAWTVTALTLFNQLLYVQARIGMLDTFMFAFIVWGLAAFCAAWDPRLTPKTLNRLLLFAGLMFGLASACKWIGIIPWALCIGLMICVRVFQHWGIVFQSPPSSTHGNRSSRISNPLPPETPWYQPDLFKSVTLGSWLLALGVIPVLAYFATFIPYLFINRTPTYTVLDFFGMQMKMWEGQQRVVNSHPYMSDWKSWPFMTRPIWYAFDKEGPAQEWVRGVLLVGNPLMMWTGLVAWMICVWKWIADRSRKDFLIAVIYAAFVFCWMAIPRKVAFYYYYYPAGMTLSLALTSVLMGRQRLSENLTNPSSRLSPVSATSERAFPYELVAIGLAAGIFIFFFPVLAGLKIPSETFRRWMWLNSWI